MCLFDDSCSLSIALILLQSLNPCPVRSVVLAEIVYNKNE